MSPINYIVVFIYVVKQFINLQFDILVLVIKYSMQLVCDYTSEIKIVGFDEDVDRLYNSMNINQVINNQDNLFN